MQEDPTEGRSGGRVTREKPRPFVSPPSSVGRCAGVLSGLVVLVVDDSPEMLLLASRILSAQGAQVVEAEDVDEAMHILGSMDFDVIVTDIVMPGGTGYDLVRRTRSEIEAETDKTPVVAISATEDFESEKAVTRSPFQAHVKKPFSPDRLVSLVAILGELDGEAVRTGIKLA